MTDQKSLPLSEESIDDILYFARSGETDDLVSTLKSIVADTTTPFSLEAEVLLAAKDVYSGNNAVHMAAGNGHFETLKHILSLIPKPVSSTAPPHPIIAHKNESGNTPLHWAALNGHVKIVELLVLTANADPTATNDAGHDSIYEAEVNEKIDIVEWILGNCGGVEGGVGVKEGETDETEKENVEKELSVQAGMEKLDLYKGDSREGTSL